MIGDAGTGISLAGRMCRTATGAALVLRNPGWVDDWEIVKQEHASMRDDKGGTLMLQTTIGRAPQQRQIPVLVVEDDDATREALHYLLADSGYEVMEAVNGALALERLRADEEPCVVLVDWWMPEMDGLRLLDTITHTPTLASHLTFVLMTAAYTPSLYDMPPVRQLMRQGRFRLLKKPFDIDNVLSLVGDAVDDLDDHLDGVGHARRKARNCSWIS